MAFAQELHRSRGGDRGDSSPAASGAQSIFWSSSRRSGEVADPRGRSPPDKQMHAAREFWHERAPDRSFAARSNEATSRRPRQTATTGRRAAHHCRARDKQRALRASLHDPRLEVVAGAVSRPFITATPAGTPTPAISHAILTHNRRRSTRVGTASSSPRRTIRPRTVASSTTRPLAAPRTPM